ncbi:TOBE domain-containing protein [Gordonia sp. zg691]|uniref:TOBE domain-containing protein n=1 Tax=Gordonia jinghuaiqii TaxID=2758710 RepID=A0A7D7R279_9ACTN|nr:TOBE domain-containing protein [Gordonia jinghuaiqii]MBD0860557.1 TOBE domain-containing protein [Gordonia jinghuaiqii]MCR5978178.1 MerR family transcriptional regulator [Gordonia jinghuaiqii]QMT01367.1 TOBE domain-containing protein [Gordonia jinghuaiqii]
MSAIRIKDAAALLGVSDDTIRRWITTGVLEQSDEGSVATVDGARLAALARERAVAPDDGAAVARSARNRFTGLVTDVQMDGVMAQVTLQCGPFEVTSLMSAQSARELALAPGAVATAVVKATTVMVETVKGTR